MDEEDDSKGKIIVGGGNAGKKLALLAAMGLALGAGNLPLDGNYRPVRPPEPMTPEREARIAKIKADAEAKRFERQRRKGYRS